MSATTSFRELSPTQHRAVQALLAGDSSGTVAHACGISDRTLRDWQGRPEFRAALHEAQSELFQAACAQLVSAAAVAIRTLVTICENRDERSSTRVAAAGKLLTFLFRSNPLPNPSPASPPATPAPSRSPLPPRLPSAGLPSEVAASPVTDVALPDRRSLPDPLPRRSRPSSEVPAANPRSRPADRPLTLKVPVGAT